jgi:hypothetical protein
MSYLLTIKLRHIIDEKLADDNQRPDYVMLGFGRRSCPNPRISKEDPEYTEINLNSFTWEKARGWIA